MRIPAIEETSRADGSRWGGALAYWLPEGANISPQGVVNSAGTVSIAKETGQAAGTITATNVRQM